MTLSSSSSFFSGSNATPTEYQTGVNLVAQATQQATAALASQNAAAASAQSAQGYSVSAGTSATTATNQASSASTSATSASNSASAAATSATNAASSASSASTSATNASNSASAASTSATNASNSASAAATSATNASNSASAAATSASNAASTLASALTKSDNLASLTNAATARTNLGVAIGSNVQAWDADLDAIGAISGTSGLLKKTAANTWSLDTTSYLSGTVAIGNGGTGATDATNARTNLGLTSLATTTPGTGVTTALGVNVGSAGAFVTNGGALGTPSSGNLANCTFPTLNQNTTGTASNVTGTVAVANGGTGLTSLASGYIPFGAGTGALGSSANLVWDGTRLVVGASTADYIGLRIKSGAATAGSIQWTDDPITTQLATILGLNTGELRMVGTSLATIMTNGSERMRIDSSGNVGIGGVSIAKFSVTSATQYNGIVGRNATNNFVEILGSSVTNDDGLFQLLSGGVVKVRLAANTFDSYILNGNVGIGTSTPAGRVHLKAPASSFVNFVMENTNGGTNAKNFDFLNNGNDFLLRLVNDAYNAANTAYSITRSGTSVSNHIWYVGAAAEAMRIDSSGRIGIGCSPSVLLDINAGADGTPRTARLGDYSGTGSMSLPAVEVLGSRLDANQSFQGRIGLSFRRTDGTAIASGTFLGMTAFGGQHGTSTSFSSANLLYSASIKGVAEGSFTSASAMPTAITFSTGSVGENLSAPNTAYGQERMRITSDGKVLIGTTTAGASKLTVADDSIQINTAKTPASATATGTTGQVCWDASYIYVCTATNTWKRAAIATW